MGSAGSTSSMSRSLAGATSPDPSPHTTPTVSRLPSGTITKWPAATSSPSGML